MKSKGQPSLYQAHLRTKVSRKDPNPHPLQDPISPAPFTVRVPSQQSNDLHWTTEKNRKTRLSQDFSCSFVPCFSFSTLRPFSGQLPCSRFLLFCRYEVTECGYW